MILICLGHHRVTEYLMDLTFVVGCPSCPTWQVGCYCSKSPLASIAQICRQKIVQYVLGHPVFDNDPLTHCVWWSIKSMSTKCGPDGTSCKQGRVRVSSSSGSGSSLEQEDGVRVARPLRQRLPRRLERRLRAHVRHRLQAPAVLPEVLKRREKERGFVNARFLCCARASDQQARLVLEVRLNTVRPGKLWT